MKRTRPQPRTHRALTQLHRLTFVRVDLMCPVDGDLADMTLRAFSPRSTEPFAGISAAAADLREIGAFLADHHDTLAGQSEQTLTVADGARGITLRVIPEPLELTLEWKRPGVDWAHASSLYVPKAPMSTAFATAARILAYDVIDVDVDTDASGGPPDAHRALGASAVEALAPWWIDVVEIGGTGPTHMPRAHRRRPR